MDEGLKDIPTSVLPRKISIKKESMFISNQVHLIWLQYTLLTFQHVSTNNNNRPQDDH
jgi:hypothetical protein